MKPGRSKQKGNSFELKVAKDLSVNLAPLKFIRTPQSGGRVGGKNFETIGQLFGQDALNLFVGDVVCVNEKEHSEKFNISVECKSYKSPDTFETLVSGNANIFKWMLESINDSEKTGKIPVIIFKWNHTPTYLGVRPGDYENAQNLSRIRFSSNSLDLDVYYLNDIIKDRSFWVSKNEN